MLILKKFITLHYELMKLKLLIIRLVPKFI
jgi:hypothetical protein